MNIVTLIASVLSGALAMAIGAAMVEAIRGIHHIYRRLDVIEQVLHIPNGYKVPASREEP